MTGRWSFHVSLTFKCRQASCIAEANAKCPHLYRRFYYCKSFTQIKCLCSALKFGDGAAVHVFVDGNEYVRHGASGARPASIENGAGNPLPTDSHSARESQNEDPPLAVESTSQGQINDQTTATEEPLYSKVVPRGQRQKNGAMADNNNEEYILEEVVLVTDSTTDTSGTFVPYGGQYKLVSGSLTLVLFD